MKTVQQSFTSVLRPGEGCTEYHRNKSGDDSDHRRTTQMLGAAITPFVCQNRIAHRESISHMAVCAVHQFCRWTIRITCKLWPG